MKYWKDAKGNIFTLGKIKTLDRSTGKITSVFALSSNGGDVIKLWDVKTQEEVDQAVQSYVNRHGWETIEGIKPEVASSGK